MIDPRTIYRLLLKLYPARFREEYGTPLERQFRDDYRDARGFRAKTWFWMQALADLALSIPAEICRELRQDVGYAMRIYRQRSATTALALVALAVAIGATTGVFSVVNALLLRSLPFREPERLVQLVNPPVGAASGREPLHAWTGRSPYLAGLATYSTAEMNLSRAQDAARVKVAETSAEFFAVLGAEPEIGRSFAPDEDLAGRDTVAVLSHALWEQVFGSDARVLGSTIRINGVPMTVIGVAPAGLDFPERAGLWTPTAYDLGHLPKLGAIMPRQFGRLKTGVSLALAARIFESESRVANRESYKYAGAMRPKLTSLRDQLAGAVGQASLVLLGVVVFVLLIACANVAHLLLSRITERRQELVTRAALGASRGRLVQQLVTECTMLTLAAAAAGMLVAQGAARLAIAAQPAQAAFQTYTIVDWRVLGFAVALAALTGVVFGVLPANLIGRMQPGTDVVRSQPHSSGSGANRLRGLLVGMQAAFTIVLVAGAVTMGRSFLKLAGSDLGFRTGNVITVSVSLDGTPAQGHKRNYYHEALERLRAIPGVTAAGGAEYLPLGGKVAFMGGRFRPDNSGEEKLARLLSATPGYFHAMGTEILQGREFTAADRNAAIVSDDFARQYPGLSLVGRTLIFHDKPLSIVGIVRTEHFGPDEGGGPQIFIPVDTWYPSNVTFVARVRGRTEAYLPVCRAAVQAVDSRVPVYNVKTLEARLGESLSSPRFYTTVVLFFGAFALLLAVAGIYGVANYVIVQRTHEIGVRLAVGASPERLRATLLRQGIAPVLAGAVVGVAGAVAVGRLAEHLIRSADPVGAAECAFAGVLLGATAVVAIWTATKRIVRLDPMRVLRAN
jgi:putative ABC transport system permease protein